MFIKGSVRALTLIGVFAVASHAGSIGVSGTDCGGDPPIVSTVFLITPDSHGDFCSAFTNDLGGPDGDSSGPSITSLTFQSDLSASPVADDYTCTTSIFAECDVTVNPDANLLTIAFFGIRFVGDVQIHGPGGGIPTGGTFYIHLASFGDSQSLEVGVNGDTSPEPGSLWLVLGAAPLCLWKGLKRITR